MDYSPEEELVQIISEIDKPENDIKINDFFYSKSDNLPRRTNLEKAINLFYTNIFSRYIFK